MDVGHGIFFWCERCGCAFCGALSGLLCILSLKPWRATLQGDSEPSPRRNGVELTTCRFWRLEPEGMAWLETKGIVRPKGCLRRSDDNALGGLPDGAAREVRIARGSLCATVTEQPADDRQVLA